jgi:hypothetical protein
MDYFPSRTCSRFRSLLDTVAADSVGLNALPPHPSVLGPSVGDDNTAPVPNLTVLGPCVGDDGLAPNLTVLGSCVGDDAAPTPNLTVLGPCVGDDVVISDARLKQDVHRIGTTVFGLPLYRFKYLGKSETYEGVMAQDVLRVMPNAVSAGAEGFYRVNYGALGARMRRVL